MIEYMQWVASLFPSISPWTHEQAVAATKLFLGDHGDFGFLSPEPLDVLAQGDVVGVLPFYYVNSQNKRIQHNLPGILLSNTCNAQRYEYILFSPLYHLARYSEFRQDVININNVKDNCSTRLLYIPEPPLDKYIADLSVVNAYSRSLIAQLVDSGKLQKYASLSQKGFYFFLSKLTVHFMRPETADACEKRCS